MKYLVNTVGALLGLAFIAFSATYLFDLVPKQDPPPEGSGAAHFFAAFGPTGWLTLVKVCELTGGVLVAIPRTRCIGLLFLGPVLINILAFHVFIAHDALHEPVVLALAAAALFLLFAERAAFAHLLTRPLPGHDLG